MLGESKLISFISCADSERSHAFYADTLGLTFVRDEPNAKVFRGGNRLLRMQLVEEMPPSRGAVLGWEVDDIESTADDLSERGVRFERYDGLDQDERGIAAFPNGDKVAWFHDPDGNILSIAELVPEP